MEYKAEFKITYSSGIHPPFQTSYRRTRLKINGNQILSDDEVRLANRLFIELLCNKKEKINWRKEGF